MKVTRILPVAIFLGVLVILSQFAKTSSTEGYSRGNASEIVAEPNQFRLKQSYTIGAEPHTMLATVYSCGSGSREKEILSIWSREANSYELQYIRTARNGETFKKPELFAVEGMPFVKISIRRDQTAPTIEAVLSVRPDSTLHEVQSKQVKDLIKIHATKS